MDAALALPVELLQRDGAAASGASTLGGLRGDGVAVIDFWTTRCERCPEALTKLDALAANLPAVKCAAVCLDDPDFAREIIEEHGWANLTHASMDAATKELVKAALGFKQVPFIVVIRKDGSAAYRGSALTFSREKDLDPLLDAPKAAPVFCADDDDF
ncbi:hypothetical protein M885DRAFT_569710 [Pelagophyceae sp. CCMP2097]|nr:hypothetical protein M885DRAFT_569710 [Pelagophyceae sp. CCMP2097]|mmetsp:Transcript_27994/g.94276  ORF Transcript_27994/g.94276 Transcript_27994/m.94276 type:complete len:158 (-) Transcript_27994:139-612(-)|eukprot:CAMPEP_0206815704 /NCGR_PEP_ID=MMETSP0975-20121206/9421_1 /ASSEMBLY_ACC=CAM_ASM_000399 /TAXON_ID=483370 /ORGANISM="non described non described, Strain CCMP2097" /LENGTH=157 /DNA_ID=CAMNT_0054357887 /DNA_START=12 /DNA_END=485 /DNA_ORIENTATION=-